MSYILRLLLLLLPGLSFAPPAKRQDSVIVRYEDGVYTAPGKPACFFHNFERAFSIKRLRRRQPLYLLLPQGGTSNTVEIYSETDYFKYQNAKELSYVMKRRTNAFMNECNGKSLHFFDPAPVDLTGLKDGKYVARYISCSRWEVMKITIATN